MQVSIVENSETAVGFGSNVTDLDAWKRNMSSLMADGNEEEVRADGFVVGRVGRIRDLQDSLDEGIVGLETASALYPHSEDA